MPRLARTVVPNVPYHLTQRGNRKQDVFFSLSDRKRYLNWLALYSSIYRFDIQAYCLMSNHVHIVGIPRKPYSMARTIQIVHGQHSRTVNREQGWHGHLWHSRYFATALDDRHLWLAMRYVEQNPLRAGIVSRAEDYVWSSAMFHCGLQADPLINQDSQILPMFDDWQKNLSDIPDDEALMMLRGRTLSGIPCGDEKFVRKISKISGQNYVKRKRGRPSKPHE
jgi:putative transposase